MENNIVFKGVFGSHLYGLNTPNSDRDFKTIFMPTKDEVILDGYKETIESKEGDIDETAIALPKFYKMMKKCDTISFDMLHTPLLPKYTLAASPLWRNLRSHRSDLYCKNMRGIIGYIKTQAAKYGHKINRLNELITFHHTLTVEDPEAQIEDTVIMFDVQTNTYKTITHNKPSGVIMENIDVQGSRYQVTATIGYLKDAVEKKIAKYGERSKKGSLQGGDWKSMSHAYRVLCQMQEMLVEGDVKFPLRNPLISDMKRGVLTRSLCRELIEQKYNVVIDRLENSDLPENPNMDNMRNLILEVYR